MRRVALDTNLLILFVVGSVAPALISKHKCLTAFEIEDFYLLSGHIDGSEFVTTPNTMTETSNLIVSGFRNSVKTNLRIALKGFCDQASEVYVPSNSASAQREYFRLGLADAAWLCLLDNETELMTVDVDLYIAAQRKGLNSTNFTHLRNL